MAFQIDTPKSIAKAFLILETLSQEGEMQLGDLSRVTQVPKPSAHRLVTALQVLGYVRQNPRTLGYSASLKLLELGGRVVQKLGLIDLARPFMVDLAHQVGETVNLGILDGLQVICIHKIESRHQLRIEQPIGSREMAYRASMGKAILAFLPPSDLHDLFAGHSVSAATDKSLGDMAAILHDLAQTRERGFAIDDEEGTLGVRCVGAPILNGSGQVIAGLSIAGPAVRITTEKLPTYGQYVREAAQRISQHWGVG